MFFSRDQRAQLIAEQAAYAAELRGLTSVGARCVGMYARKLVLEGESGWRAINAAQDLTAEVIAEAILSRCDHYSRVLAGDTTWRAG